MRIVRNNLRPGWPKEVTCQITACSSILEIEARDITQPGQRDGVEGWFRCPVCQQINHANRTLTNEAFRELQRIQSLRRQGGHHDGS